MPAFAMHVIRSLGVLPRRRPEPQIVGDDIAELVGRPSSRVERLIAGLDRGPCHGLLMVVGLLEPFDLSLEMVHLSLERFYGAPAMEHQP